MRFCLFCCALVLLSAPTLRADEPARPGPKRVFVELKVVEVYLEKLRKLGFDWEQIKANGASEKKTLDELIHSTKKDGADVKQFVGFLEALRQNSLACFLMEPTIATLDGRPASLRVGTTEVDIVPVVLDSGKIRLECRIQIATAQRGPTRPPLAKKEPADPAAPFRFDTAAELDPGKTRLLSHTRSKQSLDGKAQDTEFLIFATADFHTAIPGPSPGAPLTTTARDIELKR